MHVFPVFWLHSPYLFVVRATREFYLQTEVLELIWFPRSVRFESMLLAPHLSPKGQQGGIVICK